jgi:CheY-like chemotaxis protein/signal transduction histidine kinase/CHASE3 domain sensor protein
VSQEQPLLDPEGRKSELERRLRRALVLPAAIVFVLALILGVQVERRVDFQQWVDHSEQVLAKVSELQKDIVDQESGLRAYLLTNDDRFLEVYRRGRPAIELDEIEQLVHHNASSQAHVREVRQRYETWRNSRAARVVNDPESSKRPDSVREGKQLMDGVRAAIFDLQAYELDLRRNRIEAAQTSLLATRIAFVVLFLLAAAVLALVSRGQLARVAGFYDELMARERRSRDATERDRWVRAGEAQLAARALGEQTMEQLAEQTLRSLAEYVGADAGALFVRDVDAWIRLANFAINTEPTVAKRLALTEGPVGRAAAEKKMLHLKELPPDYLHVRSGTGEHAVVDVVLVPAISLDEVLGVLELGFLRRVDQRSLDLLERVGAIAGTAIRSANYRLRLRELLMESQQQAEELQTQQEELQAQQEELRVSNEELEQQGVALREARQVLEERQEHLERANARLEEHTQELAQAREAYRQKADEADRASRYKSEFLANMSHELRTPLNSTLILAKLLADNKSGNLDREQVRFAETIYSAGNDLLALINDILDLAKVEAGHLEVRIAPVTATDVLESLRRTFTPIAQQRKLELSISADASAGEFATDAQRLEQILKNLLSNACKFTEKGRVTLTARGDASFVWFEVCDTGIGIAPHDQYSIFEPFRQADGTTDRKYGGTGLGLSISRELAFILGGALDVESQLGKGSTFRLRLPRAAAASSEAREQPIPRAIPAPAPSDPPLSKSEPAPPAFPDDRDTLDPHRAVVLVIEDDVYFARILFDLAHERKLQCLVAHDAGSGLALAAQYPLAGVVLDVNLPDRTGLYVLDRLKRTGATRHVPVHMVSVEDRSQQALSMGAVGFLRKPAERDELAAALERIQAHGQKKERRVLIVEDDPVERMAIEKLLAAPGVETVSVDGVASAVTALSSRTFDCVVTDLGFPDGSGFDLVTRLAREEKYAFPPIIVYTARTLDRDEEERLRQLSSAVILKGARSPERLVDEVSLFLHQVENQLPPQKQQLLSKARDREAALDGKTVLVAEDDVRNIFALTKLLEPHGARVTVARNGREALDVLRQAASPDLVLMDIMMPEMDGLEAIRKIREEPEWAKLPIIALTAKAMPDDRESCLQAGANDYISKPFNTDVLLSLVRVWMPR